ncbi:hypothetical protein GA0115249_1163113 [Streptomyces sp. PpalLS-921]|nr:hypothetical protein GA0115249_1163113 [Streptomyces sp. PpalLS-921]
MLFHTRYPDATVNRLCGDGSDVRDEDVARLPPFLRHHINLLDRYSFRLPDLLRGLRPLRTPGGSGKSRRSRHRQAGASWSQIGAAAGHSKEAAQEAHNRWIDERAQQRETHGSGGWDEDDVTTA